MLKVEDILEEAIVNARTEIWKDISTNKSDGRRT